MTSPHPSRATFSQVATQPERACTAQGLLEADGLRHPDFCLLVLSFLGSKGKLLTDPALCQGLYSEYCRAHCISSYLMLKTLFLPGIRVTSTGKPGHASRFIEDTAAEKLVCGPWGDWAFGGGGALSQGPRSHVTSYSPSIRL